MKSIILTFSMVLSSMLLFGQSDSTQKLPSIKMLPKAGKVKSIYELPGDYDYKVYNQKGDLISEGKGQFIDYTNYIKGTYFILYNEQKTYFTKE